MIKNTNMKQINELKKGDFFMLKAAPVKESNVWVYDGYNRATRKYSAYKFNDVNHFTERKKGTLVHIDFEF